MPDPLSRRGLMKILSLAGLTTLIGGRATAAEAPAVGDWAAQPARDGRLKFAVDIAILGHTDAPNVAGRIGDPNAKDHFGIDTRGDSFYVEGVLYAGGTIPAPTVLTPMPGMPMIPPRRNNQIVWDFKAAKPIGHWMSRGWTLINGAREPYKDTNDTVIETARVEPYLLSDHTFVFGRFDGGNLSPDMLMTSGTEGRQDPDAERVVRAVTGGTGRFAHATGQVVQTRLGRNTSNMRSLASIGAVKAPNYLFEFDLRLA